MEFKNVKIDSIVVKKQVRTIGLNEESLKSLSESIAEKGVLQPILVKELPDNYYMIIAGERRFLASQLAALKEIPSLIIDNSDDITEIQLIENIQREDLNPVDLANSFEKLREEGKTLDEISRIIGKSLAYIKEILKILNLSEDEKDRIKKGEAYTNFTRQKNTQKDTNNSDLANKNNNLNNNYMTDNNSYTVAVMDNHIDTYETQEPQDIDGKNITENHTAVLPAEQKSEDQKPTPVNYSIAPADDTVIQKTENPSLNIQSEIQSDPFESVKPEDVFETETDYPDYSELPKTENTDIENNTVDKVSVEPDSLVDENGSAVDSKNRPVYDNDEDGNVVIVTPQDLQDLIEKFNSEDFGFKIKILKNKSLLITDITTITAHGLLVCLINNIKGYL
jgi:ParB family chromosome partitioning protein